MSWSQRWRAGIIAKGYRPWLRPGQRVLDVGCGNAVVASHLQQVLQLDLLTTDLKDYRRHPVPFVPMSKAGILPFPARSFDAVLFNDVLHHTEDAARLLQEGARVAPLILVFEDRNSRWMRAADILLNRYYFPGGLGSPRFRSREAWEELFAGLGFSCRAAEASRPLGYPFRHFLFRLEAPSDPESRHQPSPPPGQQR